MFTIRRSPVDSNFLEVMEEDLVIREYEAPFQIWKLPPSFRSIEEVELWLKKTERKLARHYAYSSLAKKAQSSHELLTKLKRKKFSQKVCDEVIEELKRLDYLCDEEFFQHAIEKEFLRGKGPHYIARKLGIEEDKVRNVISREKQHEQIQKLKSKGVSDQALARRGFDLEEIFKN